MNERDKHFLNHVLSAIAEIENLPTLRANVQGIFANKSEPKA